jgi:CBS domain-containing protein
MKVKDVLKVKGPEVITIGDTKQVKDAIRVLVNNKIGVLLVLNEHGKIVGIISERDIIKSIFSSSENFLELPISQIMTTNIIYAEYEDDITNVESIMTKNRIRHLPVMNNKILVGLISIGDIIKALLSDKDYENKYLHEYISGSVK